MLNTEVFRYFMPGAPPAVGCWLWTAAATEAGYGFFNSSGADRATVYAHRIAYEMFVGPVGDLWVLHHCDTPPCCQPVHLYLGVQSDNVRDMTVRERGRAKITADDARAIRALYASGMLLRNIAPLYGISIPAVQAVTARRTWKHVE